MLSIRKKPSSKIERNKQEKHLQKNQYAKAQTYKGHTEPYLKHP
jgi:hypothetical protein